MATFIDGTSVTPDYHLQLRKARRRRNFGIAWRGMTLCASVLGLGTLAIVGLGYFS